MQEQVKDIDFINSIFNYDALTGSLTWKERLGVPKWWNTRYAGKEPKSTDKLGYIRAKITRGDFSSYVSVHRICFFIANGYVPEIVDHIDGNVQNNKAVNLRVATHSKNAWNRAPNKGTATGMKGVSVHYDNGVATGYISRIGHNGKRIYLGFFKTAKEASDTYNKKELELRSEWVR